MELRNLCATPGARRDENGRNYVAQLPRLKLEQTFGQCVGRGLSAAVRICLQVDVGYVALYGADAEDKVGADLVATLASSDEAQNLRFTLR